MTSEEGLWVIFFQARYAGGGRAMGDVITALRRTGVCVSGNGACLSPQLPQEQEPRGLIRSREDFA